MSLTPTFELSPRESYFRAGPNTWADASILGVTLHPKYSPGYRYSFDQQHANDEALFEPYNAGDPSVDYLDWNNRRHVPRVEFYYDLSSFGPQKELALVFGFDVVTESRLHVYSSAGLLSDLTLAFGDNQFLMEVESLETIYGLFFIPVHREGSGFGGHWFFRGITGYVI